LVVVVVLVVVAVVALVFEWLKKRGGRRLWTCFLWLCVVRKEEGREGGREGGRSQFFDKQAEEEGEGGREGGRDVPLPAAMLAPGICMTVTVQDVLISCVPLFV